MIVDAHVHVFSSETISRRETLAASEPVFGWLYKDPASRMVTAGDLVSAMDEDGIDVAIVCGFPWRDNGLAGAHNDYIIDAARQHPGRLVPLAAVDPLGPGSRAEAERTLAAGAAGLGEIGVYQNDFTDAQVFEAVERLAGLCAEADCPLLLHTNEPLGHRYPGKSPMTLGGLYELVKACPDTRFQLAHMGGGIFFFTSLKKEVSRVLSRCVFDTAAAPFLYRPGVYRAFFELAGEGRLLYGSDYPLLSLARYEKEFRAAGISTEQEVSIMGGAAGTFWKLN